MNNVFYYVRRFLYEIVILFYMPVGAFKLVRQHTKASLDAKSLQRRAKLTANCLFGGRRLTPDEAFAEQYPELVADVRKKIDVINAQGEEEILELDENIKKS